MGSAAFDSDWFVFRTQDYGGIKLKKRYGGRPVIMGDEREMLNHMILTFGGLEPRGVLQINIWLIVYSGFAQCGYTARLASGNGNYCLGATLGMASNQMTPTALFVDSAGDIYVSDGLANRVQKWRPPERRDISRRAFRYLMARVLY